MVKHVDSTIRIVDKKPMKQYVMSRPAIDVLLEDPSLEEIMVNRPGAPVLAYHREFGMCETNLVLDLKTMMKYIQDLAKEKGVKLGPAMPFMDTRIFDGSRINITIPPASPAGPTITIKRFNRNPLSATEMISKGTMDVELGAFLWSIVEGQNNTPLNIMVAGGPSSGKTSMLSMLASFVPSKDRIVCVEDPIEINLSNRKNIVRMEFHPMHKQKNVTMSEMLANALRMRPDRMILGEMRGDEARVAFEAMNVGNPVMSSIYANSLEEYMEKLKGSPMCVPENLIPVADIVVIQKSIRKGDATRRRITNVYEITSESGKVKSEELFRYDIKADKIRKVKDSSKLERISTDTAAMKKKTDEKRKILERLVKNSVFEFSKVETVIQQYYEDVKIILEEL